MVKSLLLMLVNYRHPVASSRPNFDGVCMLLAGNEDDILNIPHDVCENHELAGVLGSPLEASEHMYKDLQKTYISDASGSYEQP